MRLMTTKRYLFGLLIICVSLVFRASFLTPAHAQSTTTITLTSYCPPGFELVTGNRCEFRNLYRLYTSLQNSGLGGLKTNLPPIRDGFSPQQIDLGRYLFFDPFLSADQTISCASCHHPKIGFSDGAATSTGINGKQLLRSAPSLWNVGFLNSLFWDGRAATLEDQMQGPLYDAHEMGNSEEALMSRFNQSVSYLDLFQQAFPTAGDQIRPALVYLALAAFESSLISLNSRYDQYAHGYHAALTNSEKEGMNVFRSFVARCAECHTPPLFSNQQIAVLGTPEPEGMAFDAGRGNITQVEKNRGGFKVPSLRNIAKTAPYMHSGRFKTLREAVEFYTKGRGHAVPKEEKDRLTLHWHIWNPNLNDNELDRLVEFLNTLTDESFTPLIPTHLPSGLAPIGTLPQILNLEVSKK